MKTVNTIAYCNEWVQEARESGDVQRRALSEHPTYLGVLEGVTYQDKSDRYVAKFSGGSYGPSATLKVTNAVATFLLTEVNHPLRQHKPTIYARLNVEGAVDQVLLLYLSRS